MSADDVTLTDHEYGGLPWDKPERVMRAALDALLADRLAAVQAERNQAERTLAGLRRVHAQVVERFQRARGQRDAARAEADEHAETSQQLARQIDELVLRSYAEQADAWDEGHRFTGYEPGRGENPYREERKP